MTVSRRSALKTGLAVSVVGVAGAATVPLVANAASAAENAAAAITVPGIAKTSTWKARAASSGLTTLTRKPTYIVVHHTDSPNSTDTSLEHVYALCRSIQNYHMDHNGWSDTGQHFTNARSGHVAEGRHGSLAALKAGNKLVVGAHTQGQNETSIGIENEGTYTSATPPAKLWNKLIDLVSYIAHQYGVSPSHIKGHRDFNSTDCPGNVLYGKLPALRSAVGGVLGVSFTEESTWPLLAPGSTGPQVLAAQHLLRGQGIAVPTDGVFGPSTVDAVRKVGSVNKVEHQPCYACPAPDETGLLGAAHWPHLVRPVKEGDTGDAAKAAQVLLDAKGVRSRAAGSTIVMDAAGWQSLLA